MRAIHVETWGVSLGYAVPCMGGWLIKPHGHTPYWTWAYVEEFCRIRQDPRAELERYWSPEAYA